MCCPQYNPERTRAYADDWSIFELGTTNVEVDDISRGLARQMERRLGGLCLGLVPSCYLRKARECAS